MVLKEVSKFVSNRDIKKELHAEGVPTIQLLEDVAKLGVDAVKLIPKDKEGVKEAAKLILKEAIKEAVIVIVKESVELAVKEEAKHILKEIEKKFEHHATPKDHHSSKKWALTIGLKNLFYNYFLSIQQQRKALFPAYSCFQCKHLSY